MEFPEVAEGNDGLGISARIRNSVCLPTLSGRGFRHRPAKVDPPCRPSSSSPGLTCPVPNHPPDAMHSAHEHRQRQRPYVTRYPMVACPVPVLRYVDRRPGRRMLLPGRPEDGTCLPGPLRLRPVAPAGQDPVIGQSIQSPAILRTATRLSRNRTAPGQDTSSRQPPSPESRSPHRLLSPSPDGAATGRAGFRIGSNNFRTPTRLSGDIC